MRGALRAWSSVSLVQLSRPAIARLLDFHMPRGSIQAVARHRCNRARGTTVALENVATEMIDETLGNPSVEELATWVSDARRRTLDLLADLSDAQLIGAKLEIVNRRYGRSGTP